MLPQFVIPAPPPDLGPAVQARIDAKTKPPGSLGRIETLAVQMALAQRRADPAADPAHLLLFAGDHGLVAEGVSAWPQAVTRQMVLNFLGGGAAATVFARAAGVRVTVIDAGIAAPLGDAEIAAARAAGAAAADPAAPAAAGFVRAGIRAGTRNAALGPALTGAEVAAALTLGADLAAGCGARVILLGDMGIGNTAAAALVAQAVTGLDLAALTGPGAGLDPAGVAHKRAVLARVAARASGRLAPEVALAEFGGLEIAALAGAVIGGASAGAVVLVDGFIATAAALVALAARPEAAGSCVFAHRGAEPGHGLMLDHLGVRALLALDLRLGEGTGALLALPLLRAAAAMLAEMASFADARVSGPVS